MIQKEALNLKISRSELQKGVRRLPPETETHPTFELAALLLRHIAVNYTTDQTSRAQVWRDEGEQP